MNGVCAQLTNWLAFNVRWCGDSIVSVRWQEMFGVPYFLDLVCPLFTLFFFGDNFSPFYFVSKYVHCADLLYIITLIIIFKSRDTF